LGRLRELVASAVRREGAVGDSSHEELLVAEIQELALRLRSLKGLVVTRSGRNVLGRGLSRPANLRQRHRLLSEIWNVVTLLRVRSRAAKMAIAGLLRRASSRRQCFATKIIIVATSEAPGTAPFAFV
jgi:hypothetical protein